MTQKITAAELKSLLENTDVSDKTIASYLKPAGAAPGGFNPTFEPDPQLVEIPPFESALTIGNTWCRWRRRRRFDRRLAAGEKLPVIVSEGDSWFQFPFVIEDVIDHLGEDYLVWSCGAAADTAENMIFKNPEYMTALEEQGDRVTAFLLSAAGNDVTGEDANGDPVIKTLLRRPRDGASRAEDLVDRPALERVLGRLRDGYEEVVRTVRGRFPTLPIIVHGYDFAIPYPNGPRDPRKPFWAARDEWLGMPMGALGIDEPRVRREIVVILINALYAMLEDLAARHAHVSVVDCRGTLTRVRDWADEIHGTDEGFALVAARFREVLRRVVVPRPARERAPARPLQAGGASGRGVIPPPLLIETHRELSVEADLMGIGNRERMAKGFAAMRRFERAIGEDDSLPFRFLPEGAKCGRAVCKIVASGIGYDGAFSPGWSGTGFLVAPGILLTNHHVLNTSEVAASASALFGHERAGRGRFDGPTTFRLDPGRLFLASPYTELDYAFVWVEGAPHEKFGTIDFWRGSFMGAPGSFANVIHHPDGEPKRVSLKENRIVPLGFDDILVHYAADTESGSSGAPVFTDDWRLFALHHAATGELGDALAKRIRDAGYTGRVLNEGIKTSAIATDIDARAKAGPDRAAAAELVRIVAGTDSRAGYFGTLGRPAPEARDGLERVVDAYRGAATDVDVAFWNVEWFNRHVEEKVDDVATIVADMNLDIWAFQETSPGATETLVRRLATVFDLDFGWAASEPDAPEGRQSTAVIWNRRTVEGTRCEWPGEIEGLLRLRSDDPNAARFEAVHGKIFNRYPGLFHFTAKNRDGTLAPFDFHLVPVHLKARDEGALRRRMAASLLAEAVRLMAAGGHPETDWIIGGDFNAELSTGQFAGLADAGFVALSAEDEAGGAMTYLGSRRSLIDSIFLSPGMRRGVGSEDFMIVAADRADAGFVDQVSDHRPVMVRLSLADHAGAATLGAAAVPAAGGGSGEEALIREFLTAFRRNPEHVLRDLADLLEKAEDG